MQSLTDRLSPECRDDALHTPWVSVFHKVGGDFKKGPAISDGRSEICGDAARHRRQPASNLIDEFYDSAPQARWIRRPASSRRSVAVA